MELKQYAGLQKNEAAKISRLNLSSKEKKIARKKRKPPLSNSFIIIWPLPTAILKMCGVN